MSRFTITWFRLAVPAMLVVASIVGGLGRVSGASGQVVATATPAVMVSAVASVSTVATATSMSDVPVTSAPVPVMATAPALAVASGTATTTATPTPSPTASVTSTKTGTTGAVSTVTPFAPIGGGVPPASASGLQGMHWYSWGAKVPEMPGQRRPAGGATTISRGAVASAGTFRTRGATGPFTSLTAGAHHTCGLALGGVAYCWGRNDTGQVGNGSTSMNNGLNTPELVVGGQRFVQLTAGAFHTCGIVAEGDAYCWGSNVFGQLGNGSGSNESGPRLVTGGQTFTAVSAGWGHTCAVTSTGKAWCWGSNQELSPFPETSAGGQLGDGTTINSLVPVAVASGLTFSKINSGGFHTCGVTTSTSSYCWGVNRSGELGDGTTTFRTTPVAVSGEQSFLEVRTSFGKTCGLTQTGRAWCWGNLLGDGTKNTSANPVAVAGDHTFNNLATGWGHACGLTPGGEAWCWGGNSYGALGDGSIYLGGQVIESTAPVAVAGGLAFVEITAGGDHTCAISTQGLAYCWGENWAGQLGDGSGGDGLTRVQMSPALVAGQALPTPTPTSTTTATAAPSSTLVTTATATATATPIPGPRKPFTSLVTGGFHTCGLTSGGEAYCWGSNSNGQLGDGTSDDHASPIAVGGGRRFTSLVAAAFHTCGLDVGGKAYCWGLNWADSSKSSIPILVEGNNIFSILAAGDNFVCGLDFSGAAHCWGWNGQGQLGNGLTGNGSPSANHIIPDRVLGGHVFVNLISGGGHTCGIDREKNAFCWGINWAGQLGDGTSGNERTTLVAVIGGVKFASLVLGNGHTCGLDSSGVAYCWGWNEFGQIGDGAAGSNWSNSPDRYLPTQVGVTLRFVRLTAGAYHTCGITADNIVYCWGGNGDGQLGVGITGTGWNDRSANRTTPTIISSDLKFVLIAGQNRHSCALTIDLSAYCWGYNEYGQLGDGATTNRSTPVAVDVSAIPVASATPAQTATGTATPAQTATGTATPAQTATGTATPTSFVTPTIRSVRIANLRDTSFNVSWVTDVASTGAISWEPDDGTAPMNVVFDKRGASGTFTVHFVTISGLAPSTGYRFDVVSGATTDANGGAHYLVTTGPTLGATAPDQAFGTVSLRNGGVPGSVVVHLTASGPSGTSAPLAALVTSAEQRYWGINLGNLRTTSLSATFPVTSETILNVSAGGGLEGSAAATTTVAVVRAGAFAMTLSDEVSQPLLAGWNLVALRATPATSTTASMVCTALNAVMAGTAVELNRWVEAGWEGHRCGLPVNDFTLETGLGYFIKLARPVMWTYRGAVVIVPATLSLDTGWNLVGASATSGTPSVASEICTQLNSTQAGTAVELDRWVEGDWEGHPCVLPVHDFTLQAGQGYFVRLKRPATWAPVGVAPVSASSVKR